jgi:hypothetical protein
MRWVMRAAITPEDAFVILFGMLYQLVFLLLYKSFMIGMASFGSVQLNTTCLSIPFTQ